MKADGVQSLGTGGVVIPEDAPYKDVGTYGYNNSVQHTQSKTITFNGLGTVREEQ